VPYDLLVTVPTNMGDPMIERSGLGDELNFVPTDKHTLQSKAHDNIFVIGDATDVPTSKAGSVAHFEGEVLTENILRPSSPASRSRRSSTATPTASSSPATARASCSISTTTSSRCPGSSRCPLVGPMELLGESRFNHFGKMAFKHVYWHVLLHGHPIPLMGHRMSMAGKRCRRGWQGRSR
jgi:sulfide:quinone oxidoreductase